MSTNTIPPFDESDGSNDLPQFPGFNVFAIVGRGGMGQVYRATKDGANDDVAIKEMLYSNQAKATEYFLREVENMKSLDHPNVIRLIDWGVTHRGPYLVTPFYHQGSLADGLRGRSLPWQLKDALPFFVDVLEALRYAHSVKVPFVKLAAGGFGAGTGVVHRDIKPENILLQIDSGQTIPIVADFGLAKVFDLAGLSGITPSGQGLGTPEFMPRWQAINAKRAKPDVDVWSATACFYYALTLQYPRDFVGVNRWEAVFETTIVPIQQRGLDVDPKLASIINRCLDDNGEPHYRSVDQLLTDLRPFMKLV